MIELVVVEVSHRQSSLARTVDRTSGEPVVRNGEWEDVTLEAPMDNRFQVGSFVGAIASSHIALRIQDPELFGKFHVGQALALVPIAPKVDPTADGDGAG